MLAGREVFVGVVFSFLFCFPKKHVISAMLQAVGSEVVHMVDGKVGGSTHVFSNVIELS